MKLKEKMDCILESDIIRFRNELQKKEYSKGTIESYGRSVSAFRKWSNGTLDKSIVIAWKMHLMACYAPVTVNAMLSGLNCFLKFKGLMDYQVRLLKIQRRSFSNPNRELDKREYQKLVQTARILGKERLALIMETICATGIRVSEVPFVTVEAARQGRTEISLKGKIRTILLPNKLCHRLLKYARRLRIFTGPIFCTKTGHPLSRVQIWAEMKRMCRMAGVAESKVFPHNLRHLFAKVFYQTYKDVVKLADILGHSSINTTRIYLLTTGTEHIRQLEHLALLC